MVDISDSHISIFLSNLTDTSKTIMAQTCIGFLSQYNNYNIVEDHSLNGFFNDDEDAQMMKQNKRIIINDSTSEIDDKRIVIDDSNLDQAFVLQSDQNKTSSDLCFDDFIKLLDINNDILSNKQAEQVQSLLKDHMDVFASKKPGATNLVTHHKDVGTNKPINQMPYRVSPK